MNPIFERTFLANGEREVIEINVAPQLFESEEAAITALDHAVEGYLNRNQGRGYTIYRGMTNPYSRLIIHGINN